MKKIFAFIICAVFAAGVANAQDYKNAVGLRLGYGVGLTYKHMFNATNAVDVIADFNLGNSGLFVTGLYEWSTPVIADGFNLYYGAGLNLGIAQNFFGVGISGVIGLEYKFNIPLALSLDYIPGISFGREIYYNFLGFGLGVKYTF